MPRLNDVMGKFNPPIDIEWLKDHRIAFFLHGAKLVPGEYKGKRTESYVFDITIEQIDAKTGEYVDSHFDLWLGRTGYRDSLADAINAAKPEPIGPCVLHLGEDSQGRPMWIIEDYPEGEAGEDGATPDMAAIPAKVREKPAEQPTAADAPKRERARPGR